MIRGRTMVDTNQVTTEKATICPTSHETEARSSS